MIASLDLARPEFHLPTISADDDEWNLWKLSVILDSENFEFESISNDANTRNKEWKEDSITGYKYYGFILKIEDSN